MFYLYRFLDKYEDVIYIGKTQDILKRLQVHFSNRGHLPKSCYDETNKIEILKINTKTEMNIKELYYISKFQCKYNIREKNEEVYFKDLEKNDSWVEFDFTKERKNSLESKIIKLEEENKKLKQKIRQEKEKRESFNDEFRRFSSGYYELLEVIDKYKVKTGIGWKRKKQSIVLYKI